ncbi:MAG: hypothetical protein P9L99_14550 [Candidatus Lernaella stagnicola]|nr:hypothetical protein [Candidatus Lernaella stagnicola]
MRFAVSLSVAIILLVAVACDVNFNGYTYDHPKEDWDAYDYVFADDSPDEEGDDMYVRLNIEAEGVYSGETRGVFYSTFEGAVIGDTLVFDGTFTDQRCPEMGHMRFSGTMEDDVLKGVWTVRACQWYDFYYEGELVGGRQAQ